MTGPPIKTFGGDNFEKIITNDFSITPHLAAGYFIRLSCSNRSNRLKTIERFELSLSSIPKGSPILRAGLIKNSFSSADIKYSAATETAHGAGKLSRFTSILLGPIDHLFGKIC